MAVVDRAQAEEELRHLGLQPQFLAAGMEGLVFTIGPDLLAKVWWTRDAPGVGRLRDFYDGLSAMPLPFRTPQIQDVLQAPGGHTVSIEARLPGVPLRLLLDQAPDDEALRQQGMSAVAAVVTALSALDDIPAARALPLLDAPSPWRPGVSWGNVLADLVCQRVSRYRTVLAQWAPSLAITVEWVVAQLRALDVPTLGVVHGDICPENVLVAPATITPLALLDFGFLTTSADPLFDAVLSTLLYDMYSPRAGAARAYLHAVYAGHWGQRFTRVYPLYKEAYALATSNAYSDTGQDGHFRWCMDILNDQETATLIAGA